ncbi:hypothetical protein BDW75DRAFT_228339 [Aspergillus navahoensis]
MYLQRPAMTGWPPSPYAVLAVTYFLLSLFMINSPALVGPALAAIWPSMMFYGPPPFSPPSDLDRGGSIALGPRFGAMRQATLGNPFCFEALGILLRLSGHLPHSCFFGLCGSKTASIANPCKHPTRTEEASNHSSTLP